MAILFISDLHLGAPARLADSDITLVSLLRSEEWDMIFVLGDLYDLWVSDFERAFSASSSLIECLQYRKDVSALCGNHDGALRGANQVNGVRMTESPLEFEFAGKKVAATHGDEFDSFSGSWVARVTAKVGNYLDRMAQKFRPGVSVQRELRQSFANLGGARERYVQPFAEKAMAELDADIVICGHTHMPEVRNFAEGRVYANTGSWGPEGMDYVVLDEEGVSLRSAL